MRFIPVVFAVKQNQQTVRQHNVYCKQCQQLHVSAAIVARWWLLMWPKHVALDIVYSICCGDGLCVGFVRV
jgi:hypothetical protein